MKNDKNFQIISFQGLRGFSIILIVISHCNWRLNDFGNNILMYAGALGVSCFLMISGFLSVYKYYNSCFSFKDSIMLFKHKIKKCYLLHLITLIISFPISLQFFKGGAILIDIIKLLFNISLMQSFIPIRGIYFSYNAVSWYLSLDLAQVFLIPILFVILKKAGTLFKLFTLIVIVILLEIAVYFLSFNFIDAHWLVYVCPFVRFLDFLLGGVMASLALKIENYVTTDKLYKYIIKFTQIILLNISMILLFLSFNTNNEVFSALVWAVPTMLLILSLYLGDRKKCTIYFFRNKYVLFVGNISFYIFLSHQLIIRYCNQFLKTIGITNTNVFLYLIIIAIIIIVGKELQYIEWKAKKIQ